jgi:hypothetical protein
MKTATLLIIALMLVVCNSLFAQIDYNSVSKPRSFSERNLSGPRMGLTFVLPGTELERKMREKKIEPFLSQFGWHFEYGIIPKGGGPQFVIEFVPLIAGVEYGKLIPSASLAMGVRFPSGFEFGLGPNLIAAGDGVSTGLVAVIGKSFDFSGISIPLNLAYVHSPDGGRLSFIVGYAIEH